MIDRFGKEVDFSELYMEETLSTESNKKRVNDKGEDVPETCDKCGSHIGVYLQGEPVYLCSNKDCKKYFGTVPCNIQESYMTYEWLMKQNYLDPDSTSGTSDFDDSDNEPDDCYCEYKSSLKDVELSKIEYLYFWSPIRFEPDDDTSDIRIGHENPRIFVTDKIGLCPYYTIYDSEMFQDIVKKYEADIVPILPRDLDTLSDKADVIIKLISSEAKSKSGEFNLYVYEVDKNSVSVIKHDKMYKSDNLFLIPKQNGPIRISAKPVKKSHVKYTIAVEYPRSVRESFEEMFGPVIQEAFDAITGEEIPIEKAYTMDEMKRITFSESELKHIKHDDELVSVKRPNEDEVYFGSPTNYMPEIDLNGPLFVTPYKGLASIYVGRDIVKSKIPRGNYNLQYEEWGKLGEVDKPLSDVHVYVEGYPFLEQIVVEGEGYIHCVKVKYYTDNFYRYPWMNNMEYLIAKTDNMKVEFTRSIKCKVKYYIKGRPSPKGKQYGPSKGGILQYIHDIADKIHAKYKADQKEPTGNQNCLLCAWCAEASIRGGDYLPRPVYSPRDPALEIVPGDIVGGVTKKNPGNFHDMLAHLRKDSIGQPFARWYCHVKWSQSNGGHEFLIVKIDENAFNIMDPQQGIVRPLTADDSYMKDVDWGGTYICRIDDKPFKYMKLDQINDPKKTLPWDPKKDIPYMVKHGMCTKEEAENELKNAETNLFTSELKKALHQTPIQECALPEGVYLRRARESDLTNIIQWKLDSVNPETRNDPKTIAFIENDAKENIKDTKMIMYNDDLIGVLESCYIDNGEWWYIGEIYLIPEYRGRGFGRAILQREIDSRDKIKLRVSKNNTHAIDLYKSLGFNIAEEDEYAYTMTFVKDNIQESVWGDIRNGVNPWSKKRVFHITKQGHLDGQIFKPRVPEYLNKYDPSKDKFEDVDNPRICFSNSIEGALNAILVNIGRWKTADKLGDWYVYIPERPLKEYKYRTTKQLVDEKKVYDANVTNEIWIEEPVRLKQYGIIHVDQVSDKHTKKTVPTTTGFVGHRYRYDFKYHWLVKPKVIADLPYDYSPKSVCEDMVNELSRFKYGLGYNGSIHHGSSKDFDEKYRFESPEEFEKNGGGICFDYVEFEEGYLEAYGYACRKFYISTDTRDGDTHTFILVDDGKGGFIYPEVAFELMKGVYEVKSPEEAALKVMDHIFDINDNDKKYDEIKYYVWEYEGHPPYGSTMKETTEYFSKGEPFHEGTATKIKRKD